MYVDSFIALLIVIGLILVIFGGLRALAGQDIIPKKKNVDGTPALEITGFSTQELPGDYSALFMEFRGQRYVVLQNKQSMVLLETIRLAPAPKKDKDKP